MLLLLVLGLFTDLNDGFPYSFIYLKPEKGASLPIIEIIETIKYTRGLFILWKETSTFKQYDIQLLKIYRL